MRIRFLQTVPSENPHFPFQAGQTIVVSRPTKAITAALGDGRAVVLPDPDLPDPEHAVVTKGRKAKVA